MTFDLGSVIFDTAIGRCGLVWGARGIVACALPDQGDAALQRRLLNRVPLAKAAVPPPPVAAVIDKIVRLMEGQAVDFSDAPLDMTDVPAFNRQVYALAVQIPLGRVRTYGDLARDLGDVALSQAVGRALGENPFPIIVPCHRVLGSDGRLGGFSAPGGADTKRRMLMIEKARRETAGQGDLFG